MNMTKRIVFSLAIILTCPLTYGAGTSWEYLVKTYSLVGNDELLSSKMSQLGKSNWELVNCAVSKATLTCIFKRPTS